MKTLLLALFVGVSVMLVRAEDANTTPKTVDRLQGIVKRADAPPPTNAPPRITTNSIATTNNAPRHQDRLQTIIRRGTNQPAQTQRRNSPVRSPEPDASIVSKLSEIVDIRERVAKRYEQMLAAGRASGDGLAEVELAEARVDLAQERGQPNAIITELQGLVAAQERRTKRIASQATGREPGDEFDRSQAALLEAQVRLLRAQK